MVFTVNSSLSAFAAFQNMGKAKQGADASAEGKTSSASVRSVAAQGAVDATSAKSDPGGLGATKAALDHTAAVLDAAGVAAERIADVLEQLEAKAQAAQAEDISAATRKKLEAEYDALRIRIPEIIDEASFQGENLVSADSQPLVVGVNESADRVVDIPPQNLSLGGPNVVLAGSQGIKDSAEATSAADAIRASISNLEQVRYALADSSRVVENQRAFVNKIATTIEDGLGNLIETNFEREAANLQALQVKQQLGLQVLSIANQSPQAILSMLK
ncbi:MAG: hypothetical protein HWE08_06280 [Alphaproteobacteria bacterium]|nr:hypothetical protein [Alphaproteobacteria bacterium]